LNEHSAKFLDRNSPAYVGSCTEFLLSDDIRQNFRDLTNASDMEAASTLMRTPQNHPVWVAFARSMAPMMMMASQGMAEIVVGNERRTLKVLDIAAGHGLFGIAVLRANPKAESHRRGLEERAGGSAGERKEKFGVADRYKNLPEAFSTWISERVRPDSGSEFSAPLYEPTIALLLNKLHRALKPGGKWPRWNLCLKKTE